MVVVRALDIPNRVLHKCPLKSEAGYLLRFEEGQKFSKKDSYFCRLKSFIDLVKEMERQGLIVLGGTTQTN